MPKFRELVHMGGQTGIPESFRAVYKKEIGERSEPGEAKANIMAYIKKRQGKRMSLLDIADAIGYANQSGVAPHVRRLLRSGQIRRRKLRRGSGWTYVINESPQNGPVEVTIDPSIAEQAKVKAEADAKVLEANLNREFTEQASAKESVKMEKYNEALVFTTKVDAKLWDYIISNSSTLPPDLTTLKGFVEFSRHLHEELDKLKP